MTRTNGVIETRAWVSGGKPSIVETLEDDGGNPGGHLAVSVVVAHEDSLPRDIIARACAQRHNLRVVVCNATGGEIMTSCLTSPPHFIVARDSISGEFDEAVDALLAVGTRVLVICTNPSLERVIHLLELGVHGVMLDDSSPLEVATGVQAVARGGVALNPTVAVTLVQHWRRLRQDLARSDARIVRSLTPRESEVLEAMVEGLSTKAIARRLGVAYKTVENHKIRVFEKLQVRTHAQAVSVAIGHQLVPVGPE
ncbi:MAG: LuxR C-terminal-related transcriptional regulator [Acidimicrobiales bacterium]